VVRVVAPEVRTIRVVVAVVLVDIAVPFRARRLEVAHLLRRNCA